MKTFLRNLSFMYVLVGCIFYWTDGIVRMSSATDWPWWRYSINSIILVIGLALILYFAVYAWRHGEE